MAGVSTAAHQLTQTLPHPEAPVIDPESVPLAQRHLLPRFGDPQWPIAPMSQNPSVARTPPTPSARRPWAPC
jgi:hypothetical protein